MKNDEDDKKAKKQRAYEYVNLHLKAIDAMDEGGEDRTFSMKNAKTYVAERRAKAEGKCPLEIAHLDEVQKVLDKYDHPGKEIKHTIPPVFRQTTIELFMSDSLKNWYINHPTDQGCTVIDSSPPIMKGSSKKAKSRE